ncbi:hypothetical protein JCM1393_02240 [Clostridium carnis]
MKIMIEDQYYMDENGEKSYKNDNSENQGIESKAKNSGHNESYRVDNDEGYNVFIQVSESEAEPCIINNGRDDEHITHNYSNNYEENNNFNTNNNYEIFENNYNNENDYTSKEYNENNNENLEEINSEKENCVVEEKGHITVFSKLGKKDGVSLKGAKINLYKINGVSPKLCYSEVTDDDGKIEFTNLENGCYRVIAILDRRFFEKPCYLTWNEVIIDNENKESSVIVINKIKANCYKR